MYDDIELISIKGGSKGNAIPRESHALIAASNKEKVQEKIIEWNNILKNEYSFTDSAVCVTFENLDFESAPLVKDVFKKVVHAINLIPTGVFTRSTAIDLVISSSNLGVITQDEEFIELQNQARSSVKTLLTDNIYNLLLEILKRIK